MQKFALRQDFYDTCGDRIGSVVTWEAVQRYTESTSNNNNNNNTTSSSSNDNDDDNGGHGASGFFSHLRESAPTIAQEVLNLFDDLSQLSKKFHQNRAFQKKQAIDAYRRKKRLQFKNIQDQIRSQLQQYSWAPLAIHSKFFAMKLFDGICAVELCLTICLERRYPLINAMQ